MSLSFSNPRFEDVKASIEECKDKDMTYAAPLFVTAEFINNTTGEIKSQTVFMGDFPMMTRKGTFIINGTERVVVSQLVRSPGVYFDRTLDKTSDVDVYSVKVIPGRGAWLEFDVDKRSTVGVRIDRKRRQPVTVLLKALGWTADRIREHFALVRDAAGHPREGPHRAPPTRPCSTSTASCARASRRRASPRRRCWRTCSSTRSATTWPRSAATRSTRSSGVDAPISTGTLTEDDIVRTIEYLIRLHAGEEGYEADDIDHFGNRRLRTVGELIQNQIRVGLSRMERVVRERMTTQDVEAITPQTLINIRPVVASIKEFFGTSQLSQFMDQTNPLAGLTHKRRLSALGPGGLSRDRAGFEVRDVHTVHYGRMCPIETPEGPNIGLIGSLASYGRVNAFGFIETPYRKVDDGPGHRPDRLPVRRRGGPARHRPGQRASSTRRATSPRPACSSARRAARSTYIEPNDVDYMDVSPRQMVSVATAMIPFLEHDDANRALMGANMQRQAVPLLRSESPLVGTGMELRAAVDAADVVTAEKAGVVDRGLGRLHHRHGRRRHRTRPTGWPSSPAPTRARASTRSRSSTRATGSRSARSSPTARPPTNGEMALGKNLLVAFMPWEGHNYEDAIILNQRLVQDDVLTSIHIEEHEVDARDTKLGAEEITRDIPNVSEEVLADLDERGIIRIGADVVPGDVLVGKVTPKGETELTPEERLLRAIFGEKAREVRDTSLKVPHGEAGKVIGVRVFSREDGDELAPGVNELVRVYIAQKRKIQRRRQARRPARQQGRHLEDPAARGHAVPRGRHAGRHRAQPARCARAG